MNEFVGKIILKVCPLFTTTEAKYVLMLMLLCEDYDEPYEKIANACGMDMAEVADAANMLKVIGANVSRDFNRIVISDKFRPNQSVQERIGDSVCGESNPSSGEESIAQSTNAELRGVSNSQDNAGSGKD